MTRDISPSQNLGFADVLTAKPFLKIGEVAKLMGVKPHVLRYWESEFPSLKPKKNSSGQRIYTQADVEVVGHIKNLLYNERYTISGAKRTLAQSEVPSSPVFPKKTDVFFVETLVSVKERIQRLLTLLEQKLVP